MSDEWTWLFSGAWELVDNTARGAAARLRYLLADKDVPNMDDGPEWAHRKLYEEFKV